MGKIVLEEKRLVFRRRDELLMIEPELFQARLIQPFRNPAEFRTEEV